MTDERRGQAATPGPDNDTRRQPRSELSVAASGDETERSGWRQRLLAQLAERQRRRDAQAADRAVRARARAAAKSYHNARRGGGRR